MRGHGGLSSPVIRAITNRRLEFAVACVTREVESQRAAIAF